MNLQELFDHIRDNHGLTLTESEKMEILHICSDIFETTTCYNCNEVVKMISNGHICPKCYKEQ
jgi:hypothetical protein